MRIKPGPMYLVRHPDGKNRFESDWNLTDWLIFRAMPWAIILVALATLILIIVAAAK